MDNEEVFLSFCMFLRTYKGNSIKFGVWGLHYTRVYPKVSGLAAWSENCKWYSSLPLEAVVPLFCEPV